MKHDTLVHRASTEVDTCPYPQMDAKRYPSGLPESTESNGPWDELRGTSTGGGYREMSARFLRVYRVRARLCLTFRDDRDRRPASGIRAGRPTKYARDCEISSSPQPTRARVQNRNAGSDPLRGRVSGSSCVR